MADETTQPKIIDVVAPEITKHAMGMANRSSGTTANVSPNSSEISTAAKMVSNVAANVAPPTDVIASDTVQPAEPVVVAQAVDTNTTETPKEEQPTEEVQPQTPVSSAYEASDSLPDLSQKMTTEMTNDMQSPRIYDTKEYIVPIKDTMHSHGTVGKVAAGIISAAIVVALVSAAAYFVI